MRKWQRYDLFFCESHLKGQRGIKHFKSNPWTLKRSNKLTFDSYLNASPRFIEQKSSEHLVNGKNYDNFYMSGLTEWSKMTFSPFLNLRKGYKRHFSIKKLSLVIIDFGYFRPFLNFDLIRFWKQWGCLFCKSRKRKLYKGGHIEQNQLIVLFSQDSQEKLINLGQKFSKIKHRSWGIFAIIVSCFVTFNYTLYFSNI